MVRDNINDNKMDTIVNKQPNGKVDIIQKSKMNYVVNGIAETVFDLPDGISKSDATLNYRSVLRESDNRNQDILSTPGLTTVVVNVPSSKSLFICSTKNEQESRSSNPSSSPLVSPEFKTENLILHSELILKAELNINGCNKMSQSYDDRKQDELLMNGVNVISGKEMSSVSERKCGSEDLRDFMHKKIPLPCALVFINGSSDCSNTSIQQSTFPYLESAEDDLSKECTQNSKIVQEERLVSSTGISKLPSRITRPQKCLECGKLLRGPKMLVLHMRIHTDSRPYKCEECLATFRMAGTFKRHVVAHSRQSPFTCNECGKTMKQLSTLRIHMRTHLGECPYVCDVCGKAYVRSTGLKVHKRTHSGLRSFICEKCGRSYAHAEGLRRHILTHDEPRPSHICEECGKSFTQADSLRKHIRLHTGERPYVCEVCGLGFIDSSTLKIHKLTHTGERPYECNLCKKTFTLKSCLKTHMRVHRGNTV